MFVFARQHLSILAIGLLLAGCQSRSLRFGGRAAGSGAAARAAAQEDKTIEQTAEAHAHYAAGVIEEMNGRMDTALEEYYQAALADPDNEKLAIDLSRKFVQNKQPEKAIELLTKASARPKSSGALFAQLGFVLSQAGKTDQAIAANRTAIKKSPRSILGYQNLYVNLLQNRKNDDAFKVLDEAAGQSNVSADFLISLSELYLNFSATVPAQKEVARTKALAALKRADHLKVEDASLRLRLADAFSAAGEQQRAAQLYLDALKHLPDVPLLRERIHVKLSDIYLHDKDHKRATEQLQAVVRDDPSNALAWYFLGSLAFEDKRLPEALDHFKKAISINKAFEQAYYDLALTQLSMNKPADAVSTLETARKLFSENFVTEFWTGMAYSQQKEYKSALRYFTAAEIIARASDPRRLNKEFYFQLGSTYERSGDLPQAEKYFQKCLELAPDYAEAQNYLGYMWAEHGTNLDKAKELIEKAVNAEPKNAAYLDSLGWVYYKLDKPQEGLTYILKAVELSDQPDPTLYDHLGDVYAALKQTDKAREAWHKSYSLEANEQVRKKFESNSSR